MFTALRKPIATLILLLLAATTCQAAAETVLKGAGATFPYPLYSKWFQDYAAVDPAVSFSYEAIGSGGGIKAILSRSVDFGASDKFLTDAELKGAPGKLLHIPTVMGAVAVAYNIPGVGSGLKLTPELIAGIYLGAISRWNDPRLVRDNPGQTLPDREIIVVHRADGSGTTSIFTDYLCKVDTRWSAEIGTGATVAWPVGIGAKGSSALVKQIQAAPYSIGYVEIAYALENSLATAQLKNRSGYFVKPSMLSTRAAAVHGLKKLNGDYRVSLVNQPGKDVYPIVGLTWLLVYQEQKDAGQRERLVQFLTWELRKAEKMTSTLHYTPLPKELADQVEITIQSISSPKGI
jgi:phosphate transport system substrate-binding protein